MNGASSAKKYYSRTNNADLNLANLPPPGLVSIFHRISGGLLFFPGLPALLYLLHTALRTPQDFERVRGYLGSGLAKLVIVGLVWLYAHHFFAGIRYLLLDLHLGIEKIPARQSAIVVLALGVATALICAWRIW